MFPIETNGEQIMLKPGDRKNFATLLQAYRNGQLALIESRCAKTGEYRALICAIQYNDDDTITPVPLGQMILGNPFEDYIDPTIEELPNALSEV